ncbi:MAG: sigma 54-interacting transcriptional regulator, partial [Myxococcales bacterium]
RGYGDACRGAKVDVGTGVIGLVAQKKRLLRVGNLSRARAYAEAIREEVKRSGGGAGLGAIPKLPGLPDAETQIGIPLLVRDALVGVFFVECAQKAIFSERDETLASIVGNLAASAIHHAILFRRVERQAEDRTRELCEVKAQLDGGRGLTFDHLLGESKPMKEARKLLRKVAGSPSSTVLITGENGTGKDLAAKVIHFNGDRARGPFMNITCSAIADTLLESELFGHERGAFTDAHVQKRGLFESAEGGSVMLDEIGDLPPGGQAKLLRLLENKTFRRVGGVHELRCDVRVIAATNVNLEDRVAEGRFRSDLFFRLNVVRLVVPPLREHPDDVPVLAAHFIARFNQEMKRQVKGVSSQAMEMLRAYHWPGNVRELRNVIERAFILHAGADEIRPEHLAPELRKVALPKRQDRIVPPISEDGLVLDDVERKLIAEAMERASGNQSKAARLLGVSRDTLRYRLKKHGMA